jgi:hypothetical protein
MECVGRNEKRAAFWVALTAIVGFTISSQAFAQGPGSCFGTRCLGTIDRLYVRSDGPILIGTEGDETDLDCQPREAVYLALNRDIEGFDEIMSVLMAAKLSDRPVLLRMFSGSGECSINYVTLD